VLVDTTATKLKHFMLKVNNNPGRQYGMCSHADLTYDQSVTAQHCNYALHRTPSIRCRYVPPCTQQGESEMDLEATSNSTNTKFDVNNDAEDMKCSYGEWLVKYTDPDDWILLNKDNIDSSEVPFLKTCHIKRG
jgi:hypothetical protein